MSHAASKRCSANSVTSCNPPTTSRVVSPRPSRRHGCTAAGAAFRFVRGHRASRALDADLKVVVETTTLDIGAAARHRARVGRRWLPCGDGQQGTGRIRMRGAHRSRDCRGRAVPVRGRGDGRDPDLQPGARNAASGAHHGFRGRQHDDQPVSRRWKRGGLATLSPRCRPTASPRPMPRSTSMAGMPQPRRPLANILLAAA